MFSCEYCEIVKNSFLVEHLRCFCQFGEVTGYSVLGICQHSVLNQEHNVEFLPKMGVDLFKTCSIYYLLFIYFHLFNVDINYI